MSTSFPTNQVRKRGNTIRRTESTQVNDTICENVGGSQPFLSQRYVVVDLQPPPVGGSQLVD